MTNLPAKRSERKLGIVTSIGNWRFTVHYTDCSAYNRSEFRNRCLPVTPGMKLNICSLCNPSEEDMAPFLPTIPINPYSHGWHHEFPMKAIES